MQKCPSCENEFEDGFNFCPLCGTAVNSKRFFDTIRQTFSDSIDKGYEKTKSVKPRNKFGENLKKISDSYDNSRYKGYVDYTRGKTSQSLDTISGKAMYDLVEERIAIQNKYNDLMATKIHELLEKVSALENRINKLESTENED